MHLRVDLMSSGYTTIHAKPVISITARNEQKERVLIRKHDVNPWFFVDANGNSIDGEGISGEPLHKISYIHPRETEHLRPNYKRTWRAKMPFAYNWLASQGIYDGIEILGKELIPAKPIGLLPKVGYLDIEVASPRKIMPKATNPKYPIMEIQWGDSYTGERGVLLLEHPDAKKTDKTFVTYFSEEEKLIQGFLKVVNEHEFDSLLAHYGWGFDYPYFYARAGKLDVPVNSLSPFGKFYVGFDPKRKKWEEPNAVGMDLLDSLELYAVLTKPEGRKRWGFDLKLIVGNECDFWYTDYGNDIERLWASDHDTLADYGINDIIALEKLNERRQLIARFDRIRRVFGCPLQWSTKNMKFIQTYLTRISSELKKEIPTWQYVDAPKYKGAAVQEGESVRGIHKNLAVFDMASMYPNVIVSLNLSLETKRKDSDGKIYFERSPEGILPFALKRLMGEREKVRALRTNLDASNPQWWDLFYYDQAFKYAVNSFYGAMKKIDPDIASTTTEYGRKLIMFCKDYITGQGFNADVIYWDTDSLFVKLPTDQWELGNDIEKTLQEGLTAFSKDVNAQYPFRVKFESFYKTALIYASKNYVAHAIMEDKKACDELIIKGIGGRRSDTALASMWTQRAFFNAVVKYDRNDTAMMIVKGMYNNLDKLPWSAVFIPKGFSKEEFSEYTRPSPWVRGAKNAQELFDVRFDAGKKLQLLYLNENRWPYKGELCFEGTETGREPQYSKIRVDWDKMREKVIQKKLEPFVELIGHDWSEVTKDLKQEGGKAYWGKFK